jgi:hypothetical protein
MKLSPQDVELFYKLTYALHCFVNRKLKLVQGGKTPEEVRELPFDQKVELRNALWQHPDLIESFVGENPFDLPAEELEIVKSWNDCVQGRFILVSYQKKHAVFLNDEEMVAYGVLALSDDFETILGDSLPIVLETILLPFKGAITYDGMMSPHNVSFGRGYREGFKQFFQEAKSKYGIVTSLPFSTESKKQSDEDLLRFYLKSKQNRDQYWEDIWLLIGRKPALRLLYHQEMGKIHSRQYKKRFREIGIEKGFFAILEGMIVASGLTKEEAQKAAKSIVPSEKRAWVHIFQVGK